MLALFGSCYFFNKWMMIVSRLFERKVSLNVAEVIFITEVSAVSV